MSIGDSLEPGDPVPVLSAGSEPNLGIWLVIGGESGGIKHMETAALWRSLGGFV